MDNVEEVVRVEWDDTVALVTLNRPESLNAANAALHQAVTEVWGTLASAEQLRAVVLTGAGRAFCAGGDLPLLDAMVADPAVRTRVLAEAQQLVRSLASFPVPVVAAVNGPAVGLGCSLASLCDIVVMDERAYFSDPHVSLGLVAADGGALTWPLILGLQDAKLHLYLGGRIPAEEARQLGLAQRVVPAGTSVTEATALAKKLAALPPQALQETKRILNAPLRARIDAALADALDAESRSFDTPELQASIAAFKARG